MLATILSRLARFWKPIAAILGLWAVRADAARDARLRGENKALRDNAKAQQRGRDAVADENRASDDPADLVKRLRERDGQWR